VRRAYRWYDRQPGSVRGGILSVVIVVTVGAINVARTPGFGVGLAVLIDLAQASMVAVFLTVRYVRQNRRGDSLEK
jgi:hypothetical protein